MHTVNLLRTQARANRLANHRLHAAMSALNETEFQAPRVSFFPSLALTLNHILAVDRYYLAGLQGRDDAVAQYKAFVPACDVASLTAAQAETDAALIALCDALRPGDEARVVRLDRGSRQDHSPLALTLAHLFMHQTHHRGQVHAMLSGTAIKPPQLDDFLLPSDAAARVADLAALGWSEGDLFGPR